MSKRESYTMRIGCLNCGAKGEGSFSENENPVYSRGDLQRKTTAVSKDFSVGGSGPLQIKCGHCESENVDEVAKDWQK